MKWAILMQDIRRAPEYQRWRREVRQRDGDACRVCRVHLNLHIHHIKPLEKYPDFATEFDNGITLCGNCHALLRGKEESTNLQTIIEAATKKPDRRTADQLKRLNDKFCAYLKPLLKSSDPNTSNKAVYQLFVQLQIYPNSLDQFLPLIQHLLDSENGSDEELAKQIAVEFLKDSPSGMASQVLSKYKRRIEFERQKREAAAAHRRRDYTTALKKWNPLAEQGDTNAQYHLGWMYEYGKGVEQNDEEAATWYRKAAQQRHTEAQYNLGVMYQYGSGVEQNNEEAVKWFQKAAEQGHAAAQYNLGFSYRYGNGVGQDNAEAVKWFCKASEQGYDEAQAELGVMYQYGNGVEQNNEKAVKWYQKAAERGYAEAQFSLGEILCKHGMGASQDYGEAVKWFRKAAEQGYDEAQFSLGEMYAEDEGNYEEAATWYRKAAEQGHPDAQNNLGALYEEGLNVERENEEAVKWYRKAAEQGHPNAQFHLGQMYAEGWGVEQSDEEALEWYFKAADQGDAYAQNELGHRYEDGRGIVQDYGEACQWYGKAADQCADDSDLRDGSLHDSALYNALRLRDHPY